MVTFTESDIDSVDDGTGTSVPPAGRDEQAKTNDRLGNHPTGVDGEATDDGTGSTLPSNPVPEGVEVFVQAKFGNSERVKVGLTASPTVEVPEGGSLNYRVTNTDVIHVEAKTAGDGVNFTVEQEEA